HTRLQGDWSSDVCSSDLKFELLCPIAKRYGAAVVVGSIDEDPVQAQAFTRERKVQVAERSYKLLTEKYGIAPGDIIIDPLVFPRSEERRVGKECTTGM